MHMPVNLHPQYITDDSGDKISVVIGMEEFENMLEDIEDLTAIADRKEIPKIIEAVENLASNPHPSNHKNY